jgi:hypothetical protein
MRRTDDQDCGETVRAFEGRRRAHRRMPAVIEMSPNAASIALDRRAPGTLGKKAGNALTKTAKQRP